MPAGRKLVVLREGLSTQACCDRVKILGGRVLKEFPIFSTLLVAHLDPAALGRLKAHADVEAVEDDLPVRALGGWSKPLFDRTQGGRPAEIPWGVARVKAPEVWRVCRGERVRVAVVDTGIDVDHPDLRERIGGGYTALGKGFTDENGHGTHVAGTIAAAGVAGGVYGVAPRAELFPVRVLDESGSGSLSTLIDGLTWCVQAGIEIANISLGSPVGSTALERAVRRAAERGVLLVAAAGNSGPRDESLEYPARYPHTLSVGAIDACGRVTAFSSRGEGLDLAAPGADILSTWPGGGYRRMDGTSMAAPHAAGVAALLWSALAERGCAGVSQVREALIRGCRPLSGAKGGDQGAGLVDAASSFLAAGNSLLRRPPGRSPEA